jgi:hypothetical protein
VHAELGKNATYAVIALNLLKSAEVELSELWQTVRGKFVESVGAKPARLEQGEVKLVINLFNEMAAQNSADERC